MACRSPGFNLQLSLHSSFTILFIFSIMLRNLMLPLHKKREGIACTDSNCILNETRVVLDAAGLAFIDLPFLLFDIVDLFV